MRTSKSLERNMTDTEISWPRGMDADEIIGHIETWIECRQLTCTMRASLAKHPGCTHWHLKNAASRGTLEITVWPAMCRLWVSMRTNRAAEWMNGLPEMLDAEIAQHSMIA
jgi:hypothetical protein